MCFDENAVPPLPISDDSEDNTDMQLQPNMIEIKINKKPQLFKHVICKPGVCPLNPQFGTFYEMTGLSEHWFRDGVLLATSSRYKSSKTKQKVKAWGDAEATFSRRGCNGVDHCGFVESGNQSVTEKPDCLWSVSRKNNCQTRTGTSNPHRTCPEHDTLESSGECRAMFAMLEECDPISLEGKRFGLVTFGSDHNHWCWSMAPLSAASKNLIEIAVKANPRITYRQLVSGQCIEGRTESDGSLVRDDPAFANRSMVAYHITRVRRKFGSKCKEAGLVAQAAEAIEYFSGANTSYVLTEAKLARGLMPLVVCATDEQLYLLCSSKYCTGIAIDFTFRECSDLDCFNGHSMDARIVTVLTLFRIYAQAKSAKATAWYLYHLRRECSKRGFELIWDESIVCVMVDFHHGQANGFLHHLISIFGEEEGAIMYTKLLSGCQTHLSKVISDKITLSAVSWHSEELKDVGLEVEINKGRHQLWAASV